VSAELTLLWRRGDSLAAALERLHAIKADPPAGRVPRDSMLPEFEGLDDWVPRPYREALCAAVSSNVIGLERLLLPDGLVASEIALTRDWRVMYGVRCRGIRHKRGS
jgi:hypothetical protein